MNYCILSLSRMQKVRVKVFLTGILLLRHNLCEKLEIGSSFFSNTNKWAWWMGIWHHIKCIFCKYYFLISVINSFMYFNNNFCLILCYILAGVPCMNFGSSHMCVHVTCVFQNISTRVKTWDTFCLSFTFLCDVLKLYNSPFLISLFCF